MKSETNRGSAKAKKTVTDINLKSFDNKCVRITTVSGEIFEGVASYCGKEYAAHEYGRNQAALLLTPVIFYKDEISSIVSLEDTVGPFGHFSEKYGLLEEMCLRWGTDMIEEVFNSEDNVQILRMLACMNDNFQSLAGRAVRGMAPWRSGKIAEEDDENGIGPVYLGELENMLTSLVNYNGDGEVIKEAGALLDRLAKFFS